MTRSSDPAPSACRRPRPLPVAALGRPLLGVGGTAAARGSYPTKPIRVIDPFAVAGTGDAVARMVSDTVELLLTALPTAAPHWRSTSEEMGKRVQDDARRCSDGIESAAIKPE